MRAATPRCRPRSARSHGFLPCPRPRFLLTIECSPSSERSNQWLLSLVRGTQSLSAIDVPLHGQKDLHLPRMHHNQWNEDDFSRHDKIRRQERAYEDQRAGRRPQRKPDGSEEFKCGHCRAFIGPTRSGGRHRNHCPLCLYSRHVDRSHPGDRLSDCRSLMEPIGTFARSNGEQMVVHRCGGCGAERHNRIAADDNPIALLRLQPVAPRRGKAAEQEVEDEAIAS